MEESNLQGLQQREFTLKHVATITLLSMLVGIALRNKIFTNLC